MWNICLYIEKKTHFFLPYFRGQRLCLCAGHIQQNLGCFNAITLWGLLPMSDLALTPFNNRATTEIWLAERDVIYGLFSLCFLYASASRFLTQLKNPTVEANFQNLPIFSTDPWLNNACATWALVLCLSSTEVASNIWELEFSLKATHYIWIDTWPL